MEQGLASKGTTTVSVTLLGGFSLLAGDHLLTDEINRSQKLWNVLCYLIAHRERNVLQSEFIEMFWPEENSANPVNALKTLLYRVRAMLEPLFPPGLEPILSQRGSYSWNRAICCDVDADRFSHLCQQAESPACSTEDRMELYRQATDLYRGDYLPKLSSQMWIMPLSVHYHTLYIKVVKRYAALLENASRYEELVDLCTRASQLDSLDEDLHVFVVRGLLQQGKDVPALNRYEFATELLYRNLGVRPSEELRNLYMDIMKVEKSLETDLEVIQDQLKEAASRSGAFVCEYGFFKEAYRLEARRTLRNGTCVHIGLITIAQPDGTMPRLSLLNNTMDQLLDILIHGLRRGDVIARYSSAQYVLMLPAANLEDSTKVLDRVISTFYRQYRRNYLKISYKIRELGLN